MVKADGYGIESNNAITTGSLLWQGVINCHVFYVFIVNMPKSAEHTSHTS